MRYPLFRALLLPLVYASILRVFAAEEAVLPSIQLPDDALRWYDAKDLGVEGRGWTDVKDYYDRLPAKAEGIVPVRVWDLSHQSAGMCVRFAAETPLIAVRWVLRSDKLALPHMAATGVSGVDLYGRNSTGAWRWIATGRPQAVENKVTLIDELPAGRRDYLVYLPLYNGVHSIQIGLPAHAKIARTRDPAATRKPIVFYGTSIMQGASAMRPGMAHAAILGRRLDRPIINLGFSGNGKMEPEVAQLLAELDPAIYVIDCLPNLYPKEVAERTQPLVQILRKAHPQVPIVLVEDRTYANADWIKTRRDRNDASRREFRAAYEQLVKSGVPGLHYVEGEPLMGKDREDTVDGSHPSDLGFMRYAEAMEPVLRRLLP